MKKVCKILCLVAVVCLSGLYLSSCDKDTNSSSVNSTYSSDVVEIFNQGIEYAKKGDYENAIKEYNRALEINPKYAEAYYNRGDAYDDMGDKERAIADYNRALEINPKLSWAYFGKGLAYEELERFQEAVKAYRDFISCVSTGGIPNQPGMNDFIKIAEQKIRGLEGR